MTNNDPLITPTSQKLPPITTVYPETSLPQEKKEPNKFLKILGGIAGGAAGILAPGIGSLVGSLIGGSGGSLFGSYGALYEQQRQFEEMQRYTQLSNALQQRQQQQLLDSQRQASFQLLGMQHRVGMQSQEFTTVSNLMKTRHDSEMTAVNNIKS
jgi:hypothetical protein